MQTPQDSRTPTTPLPILKSADDNLVETVAAYCRNSPSDVSKIVDESLASVERSTGKKISREAFLNRSLDIIDRAKKDKSFARGPDGKFEFATIAGGIELDLRR